MEPNAQSPVIHLYVEKGPDRGRQITVPPAGARIGRSSKSDVELTDPSLSRFHCRVFFKPDGRLCVSDLGSTNATLVNGEPVMERDLAVDNVIEIGDTGLRVINNFLLGAPGSLPPPAPPAPGAPEPASPVRIDLGLSGEPSEDAESPQSARKSPIRPWMWALLAAIVIVVQVVFFKRLTGEGSGARRAPPAPALAGLDIVYEKVEASPENIFRYEFRLKDGELAVRVDSLADNRHVAREKKIGADLLGSLSGDLSSSGFFDLEESYTGLAPGIWDSKELTITMGVRTHTVTVRNRVEPEAFARAREVLVEFARNELGLAAVALPPEKLMELGRDSVRLGKKLFDEREVRYGNLAAAIRSYDLAIWYVETIDPKPEFYPQAVSGLEDAKRELQQRYEDNRFQAERAVMLRDWATAAKHLRIVCELVPDRGDDRHAAAEKKLLDVERRIPR